MQPNTATKPAAPTAQAGTTPKPRRKRTSAVRADADYHYRRALEFVRRRGYATLADIRGLGNMTEAAREMLLRMQREGVLDAPDMFGVWTRPQAHGVEAKS